MVEKDERDLRDLSEWKFFGESAISDLKFEISQ
jgi:hypothetical protein